MFEHHIWTTKKLKKEPCIILVDIKSAFISIPHHAIVDALLSLGAGNEICQFVNDIYTNTKTCLLTSEGLSDTINVLCDVKQGCAPSSILFIVAIDPILKMVQHSCPGLNNLTYMDDEVIIEDYIYIQKI